tara:strand:+ start:637 stop:1392 length:756 start_codon:yes stop_codon:yes gene_type:complete
MKITNEYGAPEIFIKAIEADPYDKGDADFSVTGLIKPPQIARLFEEHEDKLSTDVRDEVFKLWGSGVHAVLESVAGDNAEKRFFATHPYGVKISGAIDLLEDNGAVTDYKTTSVGAVQYALKADWEAQLNLYAWLLDQNGIEATSLTICAICRDWSKPRIKKWKNYPPSPIVVIPVPLWSAERRQRFVDQRVKVHMQEATLPCTDEERWARGAPMPRAPITYVRCEDWCEVSEFCPQWRGAKDGNSKKSDS